MDPNLIRLQKEAEERVRQTQERNRRLVAEMSDFSIDPPVRYYGRQRPDYLSERASMQLGNTPAPSRPERYDKPSEDTAFRGQRLSRDTSEDTITFRKVADREDRWDRADSPAAEAHQRHIPIRYSRYRHPEPYDRPEPLEHEHKPRHPDKKAGFLKGLADLDQEVLLILFLIFLLADDEENFPLIVALLYLLM